MSSPEPQTISLPERLRGHVTRLAAEIGERNVFRPEALHAAEAYIRDTWTTQGFDVTTQNYTVRDVRSANLEVTQRGLERPDQIILVGAHYDSVLGSPGANDNGSGVAALLELTRLCAEHAPGMTLRFVAFVNEEPPFFFTPRQGSMVYSRMAKRRGDDIRLMISLETMGYYRSERRSQRYPPLFGHFYPDTADFIAFVSNFRSRAAMRRLAKAFGQASDFPLQTTATFSLVPGVCWSDHLSFWLRRYRALMITDTAFYRYPWYHSAMDTAEKLDYQRFARVTAGVCGAIDLLSREVF